jgi:hypothetical protein
MLLSKQPLKLLTAAFSGDAKTVITYDQKELISSWNLGLRPDLATVILPAQHSYVLSSTGLVIIQSEEGAHLCHQTDLANLARDAAGTPQPELSSCKLLNRNPYAFVRFSADGKRMVTIDEGGDLVFWDATTIKKTSQISFGSTFEEYWYTTRSKVPPGVEFSQDLAIMMAQDHQNDSLTLWDLRSSPKLFKVIGLPSSGEFPKRSLVSFGADNKMAVTYGSKVSLWQVTNGTDAQVLTKFTAPIFKGRELSDTITDIEFSQDGRVFVANSQDGSTTVWSVDGGLRQTVLLNALDGSYTHFNSGQAISPDTKMLASYTKAQTDHSNYKITLWDLGTLEMIGEINDVEENLYDFAFTSDGQRLIARTNQSAMMWNLGRSLLIERARVILNEAQQGDVARTGIKGRNKH